MSDRVSGVVRWFNQARGYGYLDGDDGSEVRVTREAIGDLTFVTEGMRVTYVPAVNGDGVVHAERVRVIE
ncbi:cold-shock protein [Streptomyces sp. cg2]|uniref:cold-shock protein n=1 Tax=Streptomyces sp. cg2 TaxID=3238799 RepID=UPI0034E292CB